MLPASGESAGTQFTTSRASSSGEHEIRPPYTPRPRAQQTWVHSCCSVAKLELALSDSNITAIEADIMLGTPQAASAVMLGRGPSAPDVVDAPAVPADSGDAVLRGKYLVEGLGHCSTCHTPRGVALQEKALSDKDGTAFLSGGKIEGWLAKNLRGDMHDGLGTWTEADIVAFLKGGRNEHSAVFGGMAQVVEDSTQHLTDADLAAIAKYLKTLSPADPKATQALTYDDSTYKALSSGQATVRGAMDYINNCATCHRTDGRGWTETFPRLAQSTTVNTEDPTSLIHIVLQGAEMPWTKAAPTHYAMPGFAARMTDAEVADVVTFIRSSWGNKAPAVTASQVADIRKEVHAADAPKR